MVSLTIRHRRVPQQTKGPIVHANDHVRGQEGPAACSRPCKHGVMEAVFRMEGIEEKGVGTVGEEVAYDVCMPAGDG